MIRLLVAVWLFLAAGMASADYKANPYQWRYDSYAWFSDAAASCSDGARRMNAAFTGVVRVVSYMDYECTRYDGNGASWGDLKLSVNYNCPYGGTMQYKTNPYEAWCFGADVPPPPGCKPGNEAGNVTVTTAWATGPDVGSAIANKIVPDGAIARKEVRYCSGSCIIQPKTDQSGSSCKQNQTAENGYYRISCTISFEQQGSECTAGSTSSPPVGPGPYPPPGTLPPPPTTPGDGTGKCPAGSVASGQDSSGMTICMGKATPPSTPPPSTTTNGPTTTTTDANGNTVSTTTTTKTNADGSTTTTKTTTTTAPDGTTSTRTESTVSDIPNTTTKGTTDRPEDKSDLCKQHPELTVCRNSQVTGTCGAITCDGDAIQCATLRAAAAMQCQQQSDLDALKASPLTGTGSSILDGKDPRQGEIDGLVKGSEVDMSRPQLDQAGFVGGACLPNKSFSVMGRNVTVDFSTLCSNVQPLRTVVMACAFILAYLIVSRSVLQA